MEDRKNITENSKKVSEGTKLNYYGNDCAVDKVQYAYSDLYAHLCFSTKDGEKTGTDGWYNVNSLVLDENVKILENKI